MSKEELEIVVQMINSLGGDAKTAFIVYVVTHAAGQLLGAVVSCFGFCFVAWSAVKLGRGIITPMSRFTHLARMVEPDFDPALGGSTGDRAFRQLCNIVKAQQAGVQR